MSTGVGTGTIPDAPKFPLDKDLTRYTPFFSVTTPSFTLLDRIDMYVVGEPNQIPAVGNYKLMNDWWTANTKAVTTAKILNNLQVSSWACVVDIRWKKDFNPVRKDGTNPETVAPFTYQKLGATGDTIGFYIKTYAKSAGPPSFEQGAFLLRRTVTTLGVNANPAALITAVAQVDAIVGTTNSLGITNQINYVSNTSNVVGKITFADNQECDSNWKLPVLTTTPTVGVTSTPLRSYGCYGMANPWGVSTLTQYKAATTVNGNPVAEVKGFARVWKWLAEDYADRTKVFSLERGDNVGILVYEMIDKVPNPATPTVWGTETYNWYTSSVVIAGATSLTFSLAIGVSWLIY